ncbi:uncharacterized protein PG998_004584 [Apiospora kogelbergensis]|uniref:uncharacterized protein n=1 Tax=Apiospora kogelbergensis TaxID=1337665 RepID=UPI00312DC418
MADITFIQFTGEPLPRQSARIPRAVWEEKKPQIINLYENHTLDEVVEKMAETGFIANRRQYIYQLEQWGITKYNVASANACDSGGAFSKKRKHSVAATEYGDDDHGTPSLQARSSHKRPMMEAQHTAPGEEAEGHQAAADDHERVNPVLAEGYDATANSISQTATNPDLMGLGLITTAFDDLLWLLCSSKDDWYASRENLKIAHEVFRSARQVRSRPYENPGDVDKFWSFQVYLQDIGEYLWGIKECDKTYEIYALMLESSNQDTYMKALVSCARSANSHEAYIWLASFLQEKTPTKEAPLETWDAFILAHLILARKLLECGQQNAGKLNAKNALRLRRLACSSLSDRPVAMWSTIHAVQDWYFLEVGYTCDLDFEAPAILPEMSWGYHKRSDFGAPGIKPGMLWGYHTWTYSRLAMEMSLLRSLLLDFCNLIMAQDEEVLWGGIEGYDEVPATVILFKFLWGAGFGSPRGSLLSRAVLPARALLPSRPHVSMQSRWSAWMETARALGTTIPHFLGACCDLITYLVSQHTGTPWARIDHFHSVDLVRMVSDTNAHELYLEFVRVYCSRDSGSQSGEMSELLLSYYYRCNPQRDLICRMEIPRPRSPEFYRSFLQDDSMSSATADVADDDSVSDVVVSASSHEFLEPPRGSVDSARGHAEKFEGDREGQADQQCERQPAIGCDGSGPAKHLYEKSLYEKPLYEKPL